ncbi:MULTISPECIES: VOC family protein [Chryseobacterium]|nr:MULTISPECIES: VOC family protein [Chryseobacterium]
MKARLSDVILYVRDVDHLKKFYTNHFGLEVIEEDPVWALLNAGNISIGLHKMGEQYLQPLPSGHQFDNNTKIVFEIDQDIQAARAEMISNGINMREIKTFDSYDFWLCDGSDPEGNVFQLKSRKK